MLKRTLAIVCLLIGAATGLRIAAQPTRPPNIVIILADDMGYGELGCTGHPRFKTPRLDRMAAEGARLTQFNTPMPFCAPTRSDCLSLPRPDPTPLVCSTVSGRLSASAITVPGPRRLTSAGSAASSSSTASATRPRWGPPRSTGS